MSERNPGHAAGVLRVCTVAGSIGGYATAMSKLMAAGAFATGYVLGAKAGRERYEEIRRAFGKITDDPRIKEFVIKVEDRAMNHYNNAPHTGNGVSPAPRRNRLMSALPRLD